MIPSLRRFSGAALLGLPAALTAHALVFGGEHAAGGAIHNAALALAALATLLVLGLQTRAMAQGSVLAARLRERVPCLAVLLISSSAWFAVLELCERPHAVPVMLTAAALLAASLLVRVLVHLTAESLSAIIVALESTGDFVSAPVAHRAALYVTVPRKQSRAREHRLFSRPPPRFS